GVKAVQRITAPASGTFSLTFTSPAGVTVATGAIAFNAPATGANSVESALRALAPIGPGGVNVATTVAGTYDVTFNLGGVAINPLVASTLTPRDEVQVLKITGADTSLGSFRLGFDANGDGTIDAGEKTLPIGYGASIAGAIET